MRRNEGQSQSSGLDSGAKSMQFLSVLGPTSSSKQSQKPGVSGRFIVTTASDTASVVSDEPKADSLQSAKISRSKSTSLSASKKALEVSRSRGMSMDSSQPPLPTASLPKPTRKRGGLQDVVQSLLDAKKATEDKKRTENVEETESSTDSSICANASTESITNTNPDQPDTANTKPNNPEVSITVTKPELSACEAEG
ncbi:hypothetical protein BDR26DRAFT_475524 [Obelidium mucronatum]|nr:hypothetical protein BDR26DRAFT_475524 [Obelidium mucronatum]